MPANHKSAYFLLSAFMAGAIILPAGSGCDNQKGILADKAPVPKTHFNYIPPPAQEPTTATNPSAPSANSGASEADRLLASLDINREFGHLSTLASDDYQGRRTGSSGARAAANYISSQFSDLGLQPWSAIGLTSFTHHFAAAGLESDNIVGVMSGNNADGSFIILAAHYDHLGLNGNGQPYNGADDDAAGIAAMLEVAGIFRETGIRPEKNIVFCAFSGEEEDQLGSTALGRQIFNAGLVDSVEMINIDGIGATGGGYLGVWDEGFDGATHLVKALEQAGQVLGITVKEEGTDIGSDAQPFDWQYSIPAVTVDWDWGNDPSIWHPYYHTIDDDAEHINKSTLEQATRVALLSLWLRATQP